MGDALWKDYYLPCGWGRRKKEIDQKTGWIHGRSPLKGILSEHPEQALMFIKNSFQTTALTWILSLGKKLGKRQSKIAKKLRKWEQYEENLFSFKLPSEKFLAIGKNRTACLIKTIPLFLLREHTTVFYWMEWKRNVFSILMEGCHAVVGAWTEENGGSKLTEGFCFSSSQGFIPLQSKFFLIIIFKFSIAQRFIPDRKEGFHPKYRLALSAVGGGGTTVENLFI